MCGVAVAAVDHYFFSGAIKYLAKALFVAWLFCLGLGFILYTRI